MRLPDATWEYPSFKEPYTGYKINMKIGCSKDGELTAWIFAPK